MKGTGYQCDHCANTVVDPMGVPHQYHGFGPPPPGWFVVARVPEAGTADEEHEFCCVRCLWEWATIEKQKAEGIVMQATRGMLRDESV